MCVPNLINPAPLKSSFGRPAPHAQRHGAAELPRITVPASRHCLLIRRDILHRFAQQDELARLCPLEEP